MAKSKKPTFIKQSNLPNRARGTYGGEYVDGVYNESGEQVIRPLTEEEKQWLNNFNDGYCLNNHRAKNSIFRQSPDYKDKIKKELDNQTNTRNREVLISTYISADDKEETTEDITMINNRDVWESNLVEYGFSRACDILIETFSEQLLETKSEAKRSSLLMSFGIQLHKYIQEEKSMVRRLSKKDK